MLTRIIGARWSLYSNMLTIRCGCGHEFEHRADRVKVVCPKCGWTADCVEMKRRYDRIAGSHESIQREGK